MQSAITAIRKPKCFGSAEERDNIEQECELAENTSGADRLRLAYEREWGSQR